jgi:hypothetical protein
MQALEELSADTLRLILDNLVCLWRPSQVLSNLLMLPDCFCDVWLRGQEALDMMNSEVPVCSLYRLIKKLPQNPVISVIHLPVKAMENADEFVTLGLLNAVDYVLDMMPNLSVLGIHGLKLRPVHIPVLASMLSVLRGKLKGLSLSVKEWQFCGLHGERCLLEAVCKLRNLEMLAFPDLQDFLGSSSPERTHFVQAIARGPLRTLMVRAESWRPLSDEFALAQNLTILSVPFESLKRG